MHSKLSTLQSYEVVLIQQYTKTNLIPAVSPASSRAEGREEQVCVSPPASEAQQYPEQLSGLGLQSFASGSRMLFQLISSTTNAIAYVYFNDSESEATGNECLKKTVTTVTEKNRSL